MQVEPGVGFQPGLHLGVFGTIVGDMSPTRKV